MLKLFIFAVTMLLLSGICNGQGRIGFGASRAQDTSFTKGQLRLEAYTGADSMILIALPSGTVKQVSKTAFQTLYTAGFGINLTGSRIDVDTTVMLPINAPSKTQIIGAIQAGTFSVSGQATFQDGVIIEDLPDQDDQIITYGDGGTLGLSTLTTTGIIDSFAKKQDTLGFTPKYLFNILDYGATGYWQDSTDDDGPAIQAAINAAQQCRCGATVFTPTRYGYFDIRNAIVDSVNHRYLNAQLGLNFYNPYSESQYDSVGQTITLEWETPPSMWEKYEQNTEKYLQGTGAWRSRVSYNGTSSPVNNRQPAVLSVVQGNPKILGPGVIFYTNNVDVTVINPHIVVKHDRNNGGAQLGGIDLLYSENNRIFFPRYETDTPSVFTVEPTNNVIAFRLASPNTGDNHILYGGFATSATWGAVVPDNSIVDGFCAEKCAIGIEPYSGSEIIELRKPLLRYCKYGIKTGSFGTYGGTARFLGNFEIQRRSTGAWFDQVYDIYDSLNYMTGELDFLIANYTGAPFGAVQFPNWYGSNTSGLMLNSVLSPQNKFGKDIIGKSEFRYGLSVTNLTSTGLSGVLSNNDRGASMTSFGFWGVGGSTTASTLGGKSMADKVVAYSGGSTSTGWIGGTTTNDSLDIIQNNIIRGGINMSGNWWFNTPITSTTAVADPLTIASDINGRGGIVVRNTNTGNAATANFYFDVSSGFTNYGGVLHGGTGRTPTYGGISTASKTILLDDGTLNTGIMLVTATSDPIDVIINNIRRMTFKTTGVINHNGTPVFADNAAALAGGLVAGDRYRTSTGVVMEVF